MILAGEEKMTINPDTETTGSGTTEAGTNQARTGKGTTIQAEETDKETAEDTKTTTEGKHEIRFTSFARFSQIN